MHALRRSAAADLGACVLTWLARLPLCLQLRCIGATTLDEYRQYIEKDPALER